MNADNNITMIASFPRDHKKLKSVFIGVHLWSKKVTIGGYGIDE